MLQRLTLGGSKIDIEDEHVRLVLPPHPPGSLTLAQLDDYPGRPRDRFPHSPPRRATLTARASPRFITGAAGFGFWNDPLTEPAVSPVGLWFAYATEGQLRAMVGRGNGMVESLAFPELQFNNWHHYALEWNLDVAVFSIDGAECWRTAAPPAPLGFALWLSNRTVSQSATQGFVIGWGAIRNEEWLEVKSLKIERL